MYKRTEKLKRKNLFLISLSLMLVTIMTAGVVFMSYYTKISTGFTMKAKAEVIDNKTAEKESKQRKSKVTATTSKKIVKKQEIIEQPIQEEQVQVTAEASAATQAVATTTANVYSGILANGNTAGEIGSSAAMQMAAATGVSQAVWEQIIARESNGNPNVANASGASGLFQTMPGWGSTATVQDQINSALNAYNAQGLSAWGY